MQLLPCTLLHFSLFDNTHAGLTMHCLAAEHRCNKRNVEYREACRAKAQAEQARYMCTQRLFTTAILYKLMAEKLP